MGCGVNTYVACARSNCFVSCAVHVLTPYCIMCAVIGYCLVLQTPSAEESPSAHESSPSALGAVSDSIRVDGFVRPFREQQAKEMIMKLGACSYSRVPVGPAAQLFGVVMVFGVISLSLSLSRHCGEILDGLHSHALSGDVRQRRGHRGSHRGAAGSGVAADQQLQAVSPVRHAPGCGAFACLTADCRLWPVLCCAVLCCAVLCCAVLCCAVVVFRRSICLLRVTWRGVACSEVLGSVI